MNKRLLCAHCLTEGRKAYTPPGELDSRAVEADTIVGGDAVCEVHARRAIEVQRAKRRDA